MTLQPRRARRTVRTLTLAPLALMGLALGLPARAQETTELKASPLAADAKVAGQDVPVPSRKKYVAPEYPMDAAAQGIRGIVILEVLIGEDGKVSASRITRSIQGLDEAATAAVKLWEYEPTKVAGQAVKVLLSQSITFALKLPDLQRAPGVPELKSGGSPPVPPGLREAASAAVELTLGSQGEVLEVAALDGHPVVSEALLRAARAWRFSLAEGATPPTFTVTADWKPGPPPVLTLSASDLRSSGADFLPAPPPDSPAAPASTPEVPQATGTMPPTPSAPPTAAPTATPAAPVVDTDVLTARPDPPAKEQGASAVADVLLGDNIPELVQGRRPVWPPLARLGNVTGEVVVRFSVDLAGKVSVHSAEGPDLLKATAEQAVGTWLFRRTAIDRLNLIATFKYASDRAMAKIERAP
ncbi:MAG: TonB family protein [Vicinamibacteria bacterium]|jgi:TonB family protein|nr:TonB family protein [Vicinamibacteria bacterium]